jgi:UDP-N-acetylmuramoylalanine--D-glutamate ligase
MNIAIIGYGLEGESSYRYFSKDPDNKLTICDQNSDLSLPEFSAGQLGDSYLDDLDKFDLIVRTPGIQPRLILEKNPNVSDKITTQLNEFLRVCPSRNLIGVTGTKGKGTTCSLIKSMLEADQKKVVLVGNIGVSMLDSLNEIDEPTYVVLELSSFQLIDLKQTAPSICVCLMVVPEHLNWHAHLNEYIEAKTNLFRHQSEDSVAIYFNASSFSKQIASASPGKKIPYFIEPGAHCINDKILIDNKVICDIDELNILGKHNWQNVCAALTAFWQLSSNAVAAYKGLTSFKGLEHRLEFVDEINDVLVLLQKRLKWLYSRLILT